MNQDDLRPFIAELGRLAEVYRQELSEGVVALYAEVLQEYPLPEVIQAMRHHLRDPERGQFFPKPADLVRSIEGESETRALRAWTRAELAVWDVGQYQSVDFEDPILHRVIVDMGGWPEFCAWPDEERPYRRKEFVSRYRAFLSARVTLERGKYLPGLHEADNRFRGHHAFVPEPVVIDERGAGKKALLAPEKRALPPGPSEEGREG